MALLRRMDCFVRDWPQFDTGEPINGGDLVEYCADLHRFAKEKVEKSLDEKYEIDEETGNYREWM
jgi:hypothetical protein